MVASVASILARGSTFRRLFFAEKRRPAQTLALLAFFLVPLTLGVWVRLVVPNFLAADISFETVILLGLLIGPGWAMLSGAVLSLPAVLHHEYLALPFNVVLGLAAGMIGRFVGEGRNLVLYSLHRFESLPLGAPQSEKTANRSPDSPPGSHRRDGDDPRLDRARLPASPLRAPRRQSLAAGAGLALRTDRRWHRAQGLEYASRRNVARRAETARAGSPPRRLAAPDQPSFPVQHAQLHRLAGAQPAGVGPQDDRQAGQYSARPAQGTRRLRSAARGAKVYRRLPRHRGGALRRRQAAR